MTKHTAGKYGRTIGQKERKAGWPVAATAWCFMCNGTHRWEESCVARGSHPAFGAQRAPGANADRTAA